jgi:CRISPR/Cas system Type II protein with McrA/HNH and RuvC-like nuclease domain
MQGGHCFYGGQHEMDNPEVDHVVPWSFVLEDRTWNLVLARRRCNNDKRDKLTALEDIERLCARNEQILKAEISTEAAFHRHFAEWRSRDLKSHVKGLYDQAAADNFPKWPGVPSMDTAIVPGGSL